MKSFLRFTSSESLKEEKFSSNLLIDLTKGSIFLSFLPVFEPKIFPKIFINLNSQTNFTTCKDYFPNKDQKLSKTGVYYRV